MEEENGVDLDDTNEEVVEASRNEAGQEIVTVKAGSYYGEKDAEGNRPRIEVSIPFIPGDNLEQAVELYDKDQVYLRYRRGVERDLANAIRARIYDGLKANKAPEEIVSSIENELGDFKWHPAEKRTRSSKSPEQNIFADFGNLSPEKQLEVLQILQAKAQAQLADQD